MYNVGELQHYFRVFSNKVKKKLPNVALVAVDFSHVHVLSVFSFQLFCFPFQPLHLLLLHYMKMKAR